MPGWPGRLLLGLDFYVCLPALVVAARLATGLAAAAALASALGLDALDRLDVLGPCSRSGQAGPGQPPAP